jgi:hypothetical protein
MEPTELKTTDPMRREFNRGLMVAWINADLINRARHDVRKSFVYYDNAGVFVIAMFRGPEEIGNEVFEQLNIRYWSKGIV